MAFARPAGLLRARHRQPPATVSAAKLCLPHFDDKSRAYNWLRRRARRRATSVNFATPAPIISASLPRILMAEASVTPRYAASTASAVYGGNPPYLDARTAPILVPRGEASGDVEREFLADLTQRAAAAASSLACGSILAGTTSESDEYGDVAFWLDGGDFVPGREREILNALGLTSRIAPQLKVSIPALA